MKLPKEIQNKRKMKVHNGEKDIYREYPVIFLRRKHMLRWTYYLYGAPSHQVALKFLRNEIKNIGRNVYHEVLVFGRQAFKGLPGVFNEDDAHPMEICKDKDGIYKLNRQSGKHIPLNESGTKEEHDALSVLFNTLIKVLDGKQDVFTTVFSDVTPEKRLDDQVAYLRKMYPSLRFELSAVSDSVYKMKVTRDED